MSDIEGYAETNPEIFKAGIGAIGNVLMAALRDMPEQKVVKLEHKHFQETQHEEEINYKI